MNQTEIAKRCGSLQQTAYARRATLTGGRMDGMRIIEVDNGNGISMTLMESRCLDIARLSYKGVNLGFLAKPGLVSQTKAGEFDRQFPGGMLYTCGLLNVGVPQEASDVGPLPAHGHISYIAAEDVVTDVDWKSRQIVIRGKMNYGQLFGYHLLLERRITISMDDNTIAIDDQVHNLGFRDETIMLLYHINFGWPMLSENAQLRVQHHDIEPRDDEAAKGMDHWHQFQVPDDDYAEQVFYHTPRRDDKGICTATLTNPDHDLSVDVMFRSEQLPYLTQWKSMGSGDYALGIEPATCKVAGRSRELAAGRGHYLPKQTSAPFHVELKIR